MSLPLPRPHLVAPTPDAAKPLEPETAVGIEDPDGRHRAMLERLIGTR
jgi:hypothetical protein